VEDLSKEEIEMEEKAKALKNLKIQIIVDLVLMMIWVVLLTIRLVNKDEDTFRIILYSICVLAFLVSLIINFFKYRKLKKQQ